MRIRLIAMPELSYQAESSKSRGYSFRVIRLIKFADYFVKRIVVALKIVFKLRLVIIFNDDDSLCSRICKQ